MPSKSPLEVLEKYHVGVVQQVPQLPQVVSQAQQADPEGMQVLGDAGYKWDDEIKAYVGERGYQVIYFIPSLSIYIWISGHFFKTIKNNEKLKLWVGGRGDSFVQDMMAVSGEGAELTKEPFTGPAAGVREKEPKAPMSPEDVELAVLKRKAGKNMTLPSDLMIQVGLKAKKEGQQKILNFLKQVRPLNENIVKSSDLEALVREIVKHVVSEASDKYRWWEEEPESGEDKWIEDLANKLWPDPMDIGKGSTSWRIDRAQKAKSGEMVYKLTKTQKVTRSRWIINRNGKWYFLDIRPDHTKKWMEIPSENIPQQPPTEPKVSEQGGGGGGGGAGGGGAGAGAGGGSSSAGVSGGTTTSHVSGYSTPGAFKRKKRREESNKLQEGGIADREAQGVAEKIFQNIKSVSEISNMGGDTWYKVVSDEGTGLIKKDKQGKWFKVDLKSKIQEPILDEEQIDEMTTTSGGGGSSAGTPGYNVPGAFSRRGGSKKGIAGSAALGYTLTAQGKEDMKLKADKLYEGKKK